MKKAVIALTYLLTISSSFLFAQSGTLDQSFGKGGYIKMYGGDNLHVIALAVQQDNRIVAGGGFKVTDTLATGATYYNVKPVLQRYNSNSLLDMSFGTGGQTFLPFTPSDGVHVPAKAQVATIDILPGGKFLVAESNFWYKAGPKQGELDSTSQYVLCRVKNNGYLDSAFGNNGSVTGNFGANKVWNVTAAALANGKSIVGANIKLNAQPNVMLSLARYNKNGYLDSTFGVKGMVALTKIDSAFFNVGNILALPNNKLLITGTKAIYVFNSSSRLHLDSLKQYSFAMIRLLPNGVIDSSFGLNGIATFAFQNMVIDRMQDKITGSYLTPPVKGIVLANNNIVLSGTTFHQNAFNFTTVEYRPNGKRNISFGSGARIYQPSQPSDIKTALAALDSSASNIVIGGTANLKLELIKYFSYGNLDSSFGSKGITNTTVQNDTTEMTAMKVESDEKIIAAAIVDDNTYESSKIGTSYLLRYKNSNAVAAIENKQAITAITAPGKRIILSPNPAKDIITIQGLSASSKTIILMDMNGKIIQQLTTANASHSFNIKSLSAGVYFIKVDDKNNTTTLRFVKE